jgi:hypothetical protein
VFGDGETPIEQKVRWQSHSYLTVGVDGALADVIAILAIAEVKAQTL